jgi:hypothetical protein
MNNQQPSVFISYAREDIEMVEKIYDDFLNSGVVPWLDQEEILPGDNWKLKIKEAIKSCTYFLAVLSSNSVSKTGYVQKELKMALEMLEEKPPNERFLIPVKINDCKPQDDRIDDIHQADLSKNYDKGIKLILKAILPGQFRKKQKVQSVKKETTVKPVIEETQVKSDEQQNRIVKKQMPAAKKINKKYELRSKPEKLSDNEVKKRLGGSWRPTQYIENDYVENNDGTVTDRATGLMWQKEGSDDRIRFSDAEKYIEQLNKSTFGGYNDWRLPTIDELVSLLEKEKSDNGLYIDPVFSNKQDWCWTADNRSSGGAFIVNFNDGIVYDNRSINLFVRAVRSFPDNDG